MMVAGEMQETVDEHRIKQTIVWFSGYPGFLPYNAGTQKNLPFTAVPKRKNISYTVSPPKTLL